MTDDQQKQYYRQALSDLSVIRQDCADTKANVAELTTAVARIEVRGDAWDRRLSLVESWQSAKDEEVTATSAHRVAAVEDTIKRMAERRWSRVQIAIGAAVTLATGGILAWVSAALAGCM